MNRKPNHLIKEKSPYLQQHAHNPVNWYPWSNEAFELAKSRDIPIFLSIGYSTCHWCHVMERESFENKEVADALNSTFICIKVDREELPHVDNLYMELAQSMMAGSAGWPLNLILTPELGPIYACTYLPPRTTDHLMGLIELTEEFGLSWRSPERAALLLQSDKILEVHSHTKQSRGEMFPPNEKIEEGIDMLFKIADPVYGGLKGTPKFPIAYQYSFLMNVSLTTGDSRALFLAEKTLQKIHQGGIYDHLGGGFSRYAIDEKWLVPHFEKMLYDNALLANTYTTAYLITENTDYKFVAEETLDYILRDLSGPYGGFYAGEDSESLGEEGGYYTWHYKDIEHVIPNEMRDHFLNFFNITPEGNYNGKNILNTPLTLHEYCSKHSINSLYFADVVMKLRETLFNIRKTREPPRKDEKIITAWNGMTIHALASAGSTFDRDDYLSAATNAAQFICDSLWKSGKLFRRWCTGEANHPAVLDDYAWTIKGFLSLYEAGRGTEWLKKAIELSSILSASFKSDDGAFYYTHQKLPTLTRYCLFSDGAEPSGNAIHSENLLKLYALTGNTQFKYEAEDTLRAVERYLGNYSPGYLYHLNVLGRYYDTSAPTFVVALNELEDLKKEINLLLNENHIPHKNILWRSPEIEAIAPFTKMQEPIDGRTTLYICRKGRCEAPLTDFNEMSDKLKHLY